MITPRFEHTVTIGDANRAPSRDEVVRLLEKPDQHAVINLSAVAPAERPAFFLTLMTRLWELRKRYGRPHWIVVNDAHPLMPATPAVGRRAANLPRLRGTVMVTPDPRQLAPGAIEGVSTLVAAGQPRPTRCVRSARRAACRCRRWRSRARGDARSRSRDPVAAGQRRVRRASSASAAVANQGAEVPALPTRGPLTQAIPPFPRRNSRFPPQSSRTSTAPSLQSSLHGVVRRIPMARTRWM